ncbi:ATP-dependent zinc metalloprotease FtsH [Mycoplasmatota bacterium zrk1]
MAQVKRPVPKRKMNIGDIILGIILIGIIIGVYYSFISKNEQPIKLTYPEFYEEMRNDNVSNVITIPESGDYNQGIFNASGTLKDGTEYFVTIPTTSKYDEIIDIAVLNDVTMDPQAVSNFDFFSIITFLFPILLILAVLFFLMRNAGGGAGNKAFDFGKSRAKLSRSKTTSFKDVAGVDEEKEELSELIDFLKNPKKYIEIGARIPKGVLLVGPPGTGKTLLARAVAGEADVPFYLISGSDFVEMFVGVGASRVRDMFKTAKQTAPCIIFIDEIDAVGRQRGAGLGGGNDEREQTLNQLLVEMDGFGANSGIIVMAATNRPDVLDPALLRPGRFDRQITIVNPDVKGRTAILEVHARNKKMAKTVNLEDVAKRTPGFSGADLENLLNEAALLAARGNRKSFNIKDIDEAVDRVMMGPAKKTRKFSKSERNLIAHHESGHAVIGVKLDDANIVHKVTIIPRGQAGGYALMLPEEERFLETKTSLLDRITGLLGGRVSEELIFNEISTGAHNDFQKATQIARAMVTEYGMSSLGPIQYERSTGPVFLGRDYNKSKDFSEKMAIEIDNAVKEIIDECYSRAQKTLTDNMDLVKRIAHYLLEVETLTKEEIYEIVDTSHLKWWDEKKTEKNETQEVSE